MELLREDPVLGGVHKLVIAMMRQGSAPFRRVHDAASGEYLLSQR